VIVAKARVNSKQIAELEARIGHVFKTHERLVRALTHSSATKTASRRAGRCSRI